MSDNRQLTGKKNTSKPLDPLSSGSLDPLIGRRLGEFVIKEKLGEGGFGIVYRAEQPVLAREAVVKVLHKKHHSNKEWIERFTREARLASHLEHPYTAHIYAFGVEPDGLLWIAMELVRGTPLNILLKKQGPLPVERFVPLLDKICEVVHTAHEAGIVHRDIKPANVMVIARAGRLLPKLLDFGIAKGGAQLESPASSITPEQVWRSVDATVTDSDSTLATQLSVTEVRPRDSDDSTVSAAYSPVADRGEFVTAGVVGSPPYMAPEQWINSSTVTAQTDVYALGVLSYEVLTGRKPFNGSTSDLFKAHMRQLVPSLGPTFAPALDSVLAKAMAKKPEERYSTPIDFAKAFREAAGFSSEPVSLPVLDELTLESALTAAPQPIAESIAMLVAARNIYQSREQMLEVAGAIAHYTGILALACRAKLLECEPEEQLQELLFRLRTGGIEEREWVLLGVAICRPFASQRNLFPLPELVDFFTDEAGELSSSARMLEGLFELQSLRPGLGEEQMHELVQRAFTQLSALLLRLDFLNNYHLIVTYEQRTERWMGHQLRLEAPKKAAEGVRLVSPDGEELCELSPLAMVAAPTTGARNELFLFYGRGRQGARFLARPHRFECSDEKFWRWFSERVFQAEDEEVTTAPDERAPYLGLSTFTAADADLFFGREKEAERVLNRLRLQPMLAVVGPSGAGKSSFVQAGIVPGLPKDWRVFMTRPGAAPITTITTRLIREMGGLLSHDQSSGRPTEIEQRSQMIKMWFSDPDFLNSYLKAKMGNGLVIVIDQFEEIFTLCLDNEERRVYCEGLSRAATSADLPIRIILTLRDDFLVRARELPGLGERLVQGLELLTTPGTEDLIRILKEPARKAGYKFEDESLPCEIAESVAGKQGALPLLAFTASKLWEMRDRESKTLERKPYEAMGGVGGALAQHAEEMMWEMTHEEQLLVREAFRRLVTSEGTRAVMPRNELLQVLGSGAAAEAALEKLVRARLLSASEGEGGQERVEVVHEALLAAWPRLVKWRQEDAEGARLRDQLQAAARQWDERGRPKGLLWRDEALVEYELWRARYPGRLTYIEDEFGQQSLAEANRLRNTKRWIAIGAASILLLGFLILFWQRQKAVESENEARLQVLHLYAEQGRQELLAGNSDRALVFLSEAYRGGKSDAALKFMMRQAILDFEPIELPVLEGHADSVRDVAFSPDGSLMATASADSTARLWSRNGDPGVVLRGHRGSVNTVAFSPEGKHILTASSDGSFRIWSLDGRCKLAVDAHIGSVNSAAFSPDGRRVVTTGLDRVAKVWSVSDGRQLAELTGHSSSVVSAAFSPDGDWIVTAGHDWTARVWESKTGRLIGEMAGHKAVVHSVCFSPDGLRILTAGGDGSLKVWNAANRKLLGSMDEHGAIVHRAVYNPDGTLIASCGADRTVKVWDSLSFKLLRSIQINEFTANALVFSMDGHRLLVASGDQTGRVLSVELESRSPDEVAEFVRDRLKLKLVGEHLEPIQGKGEKDDAKSSTASVSVYPTPLPSTFVLNHYNFDVVRVDERGRIVERTTREARYYIEDLGNGISMDMVAIPGGVFMMGSPEGEADREKEFESPQHRVEVKPFFMSRFEVTQAQWKAIMGTNPSHFKGDDLPVDSVSWYDAVEFCERLSERTGKQYRLPTEAQWEYACRAGTDTPFHFGPTLTPEIANYHGGYPYGKAARGFFREHPTQVGSFGVANAFGLYDMHGNVLEWVVDGIHKGYDGAPADARAWEQSRDSSDIRVLRGGSWNHYGYGCRSAFRVRYTAATRYYLAGFRVVLSDTGWLERAEIEKD